MKTLLSSIFLACVTVPLAAAGPASRLPSPALNLELAAPIKTWDEAIPLGNGTMGVLFWGETNRLRKCG